MKKITFVLITFLLSSTLSFSTSLIDFLWTGGVTSNSVVVVTKVQTAYDGQPVRIVVATDTNITLGIIYSNIDSAILSTNNLVLKFNINGLSPLTQYFYRVEVGGVIDDVKTGKFFTYPVENTPYSFVFAASCGNSGNANASIFETIKNVNPLFFLHVGDFHYGNIENNDISAYRSNYEGKFVGSQAELYQNVPVAYMWDDHDFGPNNSCRLCDGKPAVHQVYRNYVPHYQLAGADTTPIFQAFTVGRVRFILTDLRSKRDPGKCYNGNTSHTSSPYYSSGKTRTPDGPNKTILGAEQKEWLKQELLSSSENHKLVIWVSTVPWIGTGSLDDRWWSYSYERREIAQFIEENCIHNLCMIAGDMHGVAIDDGSHNGYYDDNTTSGNYSATSAHGFPVFHTASLTSGSSVKGGPYSQGQRGGSGQFGWISIVDTSENIVVNWEARNTSNQIVTGASGGLNVGGNISYSFSPEPSLNLADTIFLTNGDSVIIDAGAGFASYLWQDSSTNQSIMVTSGGTYYITATNSFGCEMIDSIEVVETSNFDSQAINLLSGWNIFSTYIIPTYTDCDSVFSPIFQELVIVKDELGGIFWDEYQINNIGDLTIGKAYQAKLLQNTSLIVSGVEAIPENTQISLMQGWSLLGYLRTNSAPIFTMLNSIVSDIIIVKDGFGNVYWPQNSIDQIVNMTPGLGYQIKMQNASNFTYSANN